MGEHHARHYNDARTPAIWTAASRYPFLGQFVVSSVSCSGNLYTDAGAESQPEFVMTRTSWITLLATVVLSSFAGSAEKGGKVSWPQFRGPNSSGLGEGKPPVHFGPGQKDLVVDVNGEVQESGKDFDYRDKLRDEEWVHQIRRSIVTLYQKLVGRGTIKSFGAEWETGS